jgi:hypothetical protein
MHKTDHQQKNKRNWHAYQTVISRIILAKIRIVQIVIVGVTHDTGLKKIKIKYLNFNQKKRSRSNLLSSKQLWLQTDRHLMMSYTLFELKRKINTSTWYARQSFEIMFTNCFGGIFQNTNYANGILSWILTNEKI